MENLIALFQTYAPFGALLVVVVSLLIVGLSSTTKTEYAPKEHNPKFSQNGWIDASKNYRG